MNNILTVIKHGHGMYYCINYVLVFALFTNILLIPYHIPYLYWTETGQDIHEDYTYNMIRLFDCTVLSSNGPKRERLCLKIVLGQAWFEMYCSFIIYYSCCIYSIEVRIWSTDWSHITTTSSATTACMSSLYYIHAVGIGQPFSKLFWVFLSASSKYWVF